MPTHLIVYSDYLCPWCFNVSVRLHRLERELGDELKLEWRTFLLRPRPKAGRSLDDFRAYTQSWLRPAADDDAGTFRVWATDAGPPSHSIPPHLVAKAAAELSDAAFRDIHERLLRAYFSDNRDITDRETLAAIWREAALPDHELARADAPHILERVLADHNEAVELGMTGVPAVRPAGQDVFVSGAQPYESYRRWALKLRAASDAG